MPTSPTPTRPDVVVVGAGPVGLVAAAELARRGVSIRIIDKLPGPLPESRAIAVHARSLDMFERLGLVDQIIDTGHKSVGMHMYAASRQLFHTPFDNVDSAFPFTLVTPQPETERVLTQRLQDLGVPIEHGAELVGLTQGADGVHLTLRRADATEHTLDTSWVIGADGAHSIVRHLVGTRLQGSFHGERFILGDVDVHAGHHLEPSSMYTFFSPEGPVVTIPMAEGRIRFLAQIHDAPGTPLNLHPPLAQLQRIVDQRIGSIRILQPHWLTCFEVHHGQVPSYRHGRVFLAGDAAHIHSPAGGQGMNTGMQDAFNLSWKLAAALHGRAGDTLLDSYHTERHPVARKVINLTDKMTKVGTLHGGAGVVRNAIMRALDDIGAGPKTLANVLEEGNVAYPDSPVVLRTGRRVAKVVAGEHLPHIDDDRLRKQLGAVFGPDNPGHVVLTLGAGSPPPGSGAAGSPQVLISSTDAPVSGYDTVIADPTGVVAQRYGLHHGGRAVIRPDGYTGAITNLDDHSGVADYFSLISA
jgi:2-polyprenyl-6-methoxyphenol hydroxylase-like FAD-dependent oxidoreductase